MMYGPLRKTFVSARMVTDHRATPALSPPITTRPLCSTPTMQVTSADSIGSPRRLCGSFRSFLTNSSRSGRGGRPAVQPGPAHGGGADPFGAGIDVHRVAAQ